MEKWKITEEQIVTLQDACKINELLLIKPESKELISTDSIDESFNVLFLNTSFGYSFEKAFIVHNLSEIVKVIKNIGSGAVILLAEDKLSVMDPKGDIKCNYLYASEDIVDNINKVYGLYQDYISSIKNNEQTKRFKFADIFFKRIKTFSSFNFNTLSFQKDQIIIYDNTGSTEINQKDNVILKTESEFDKNFRLDLDLQDFRKLKEGNYICYGSPQGFILFEDEENKNVYLLACNNL